MRSVVQRVSRAAVAVDGRTVGSIGTGIVVLLGIKDEDDEAVIRWMADKIANLRIFEDDAGKMNRSLFDIGGEMLIISQFTLYGDCRKGRRPGYSAAAPPARAERIYDMFVAEVARLRIPTATGVFGARMEVSLTNDGPVTLLLDSDKTF